jgi:hypothetical protein
VTEVAESDVPVALYALGMANVKVSVEPVSARIPVPVVEAMPDARVGVEMEEVELDGLMVWEEVGRVMKEDAWVVVAGREDCGMEIEIPSAELLAAAGVGMRVAVE